MRKQVYISADYSETDGDKDVVDELNKWGNDDYHRVDYEKRANKRSIMEALDKIKKILLTSNNDSFDIAYNIYIIICAEEKKEQQFELFEFVCKNFGMEESDESTEIAHAPYKDQKESLKEKYGAILNSVLESCLKENLDEKEFYRKLWRNITESYFFESDAAKIFALYYTIIDKRIPYFQLDDNCKVSAKYCYVTHELRLHQNDRCKRFTLF